MAVEGQAQGDIRYSLGQSILTAQPGKVGNLYADPENIIGVYTDGLSIFIHVFDLTQFVAIGVLRLMHTQIL